MPRLNVLDLQKQIRSLPKPVIAMVAGYAMAVVMSSISSAISRSRRKMHVSAKPDPASALSTEDLAPLTSPGSSARRKPAKSGFSAVSTAPRKRLQMGLVNKVVPLVELEAETLRWCREILRHSPLALRCLKSALNADCDGQMGLLDLAGNATLLYYLSEEAQEGKNAFLEKREPDFSKFRRLP